MSFLYTLPKVFHSVVSASSVAKGAIAGDVDVGISIPLGIVIGLVASFIQSFGLAIQRRSHVLNSQLPDWERKAEYRRPLWLVGFVVFITSNILGSLVQIASLPVVILAPLGAVSLLWNALFARLLLRPPLILGTALIAGGAALIAVYGIVPETTRSLDDLVALFARPAFLAWFCVEAAVVIVCLIATHTAEYSFAKRLEAASYAMLGSEPESVQPSPSPVPSHSDCTEDFATTNHTHERSLLLDFKQNSGQSQPQGSSPYKYGSSTNNSALTILAPSHLVGGRTLLFLALAYAATSGIMSGLCLIFAKSGVQLLLLTLGGLNQFYRWEAWALVGGLVLFALGQLWYLNRGLRLTDPAFVCPSAFCFYNFSSILNGLVYFDQVSQLSWLHLALVVLGMLTLLAGVWSISAEAGIAYVWSDEPQRVEEDVDEPEDGFILASAVDGDVGPTTTTNKMRYEWTGGKRPAAVPMDRSAYSEGRCSRLEGSVSMHTLPRLPTSAAYDSLLLASSSRAPDEPVPRRTVSCGGESQQRPRRSHAEGFSPSARTDLSRCRSIGVANSQGAGASSSGGTGQVMSPAGLTIGLSPMSPGFGVAASGGQRSARRLSGLGLGLGLGLGRDDGGARRRSVSEGDVQEAEQLLPAVNLSNNRSQGRTATSRGWRLIVSLVRATQRANQESS